MTVKSYKNERNYYWVAEAQEWPRIKTGSELEKAVF